MLRYAVRRLIGLVPRLVLISVVLFLVIQLPKGGPADIYAADPSASPASLERIRELWGLNRPLHIQYLSWIRNLLMGDWGMSFAERRAASLVVTERIGNTLWLTTGALLLALVGGFVLGTLAALSRSRLFKSLVQVISVIGMSIPTFWSGSLVLLFFAVYLDWIPSGGMSTIGQPFSLGDRLWHLLAPAMVLGSVYIAQWTRYVQAGLEDSLREDFIRTAHAKGLAPWRVILRHGLPNVALPLVTVLGLQAPRLLSGAMVTEVVFSWPGVGRLLTSSLLNRDYPVVLGTLMVLVLAVVIINLLTDLLYAVLDPRVRYD